MPYPRFYLNRHSDINAQLMKWQGFVLSKTQKMSLAHPMHNPGWKGKNMRNLVISPLLVRSVILSLGVAFLMNLIRSNPDLMALCR